MPEYYINDNGTWRYLKEYTVIGAVQVHQYWVNDLNVWRCVHNRIMLSDINAQFLSTAFVRFANDGQILRNNVFLSRWSQYADVVSDFEIRLTITSGTNPSGSAVSTWLNLGTDRQWQQTAGGVQDHECIGTLEIRSADSQLVVASSTLILSAFGSA